MFINTFYSNHPDIELAVEELASGAKNKDMALVFANPERDLGKLAECLDQKFPSSVVVAGTTSYSGVLLPEGYFSSEKYSLAMMTFSEKNSSFGVGISTTGGNEEAALEAIKQAEEVADRRGELPNLVWIMATPGAEEVIAKAVSEYYHHSIPIFGGSAGDDSLGGSYRVFDRHTVTSVGVCVVLFYIRSDFGFSFSSGYRALPPHGKITKTEGREIIEIDNTPAAYVFNQWRGGDLTLYLKEDCPSVFEMMALRPLGKLIGEIYGDPYFLLSHIEKITPRKGLLGFTEFKVGDVVYLMETTPDELTLRAGGAIESALSMIDEHAVISGALITYCGGCLTEMTKNDKGRVLKMHEHMKNKLPGVPFLGFFSLGEQGSFANEEVHHGNLMLSVIIFMDGQ